MYTTYDTMQQAWCGCTWAGLVTAPLHLMSAGCDKLVHSVRRNVICDGLAGWSQRLDIHSIVLPARRGGTKAYRSPGLPGPGEVNFAARRGVPANHVSNPPLEHGKSKGKRRAVHGIGRCRRDRQGKLCR